MAPMRLLDMTSYFPLLWVITDQSGRIKEESTNFYELRDGLGFDEEKELTETLCLKKENGASICLAGQQLRHFTMVYKTEGDLQGHLFIEDPAFEVLEGELKEQQQANQELNRILEHSYDGISINTADGITIKLNDSVERFTGIPKEYFIGKSADKLVTRGFLQESLTTRIIETKKPVTAFQGGKNGRQIVMTGSPLFNIEGEVDKIIYNIRDVSELFKYYRECEKAEITASVSRNIDLSLPVLQSNAMAKIHEIVKRINPIDATVLLLGETGVGKDVLAKHIHESSPRKMGQLVKVNCGAIPAELMEAELFGYEAGAFSGASRYGKAGMFEMADGGILFLDEIGELPLALQVKLLQVLQDKEIRRVGGSKTKRVDVRIIAATNRDLKAMAEKGEFREDLYYRLNILPIHVPPLRDRRADILPLADFYVAKFNEAFGMKRRLSKALQNRLFMHAWPGNVRELANLIQRMMILANNNELGLNDLPEEYQEQLDSGLDEGSLLQRTAEQAERTLLEDALRTYKTTYDIAEALQSSQATIARKLKKYQIGAEAKG